MKILSKCKWDQKNGPKILFKALFTILLNNLYIYKILKICSKNNAVFNSSKTNHNFHFTLLNDDFVT